MALLVDDGGYRFGLLCCGRWGGAGQGAGWVHEAGGVESVEGYVGAEEEGRGGLGVVVQGEEELEVFGARESFPVGVGAEAEVEEGNVGDSVWRIGSS